MKSPRRPRVTDSQELCLHNELWGLFFIFVSILLLFSLISYSPRDPSFFSAGNGDGVHNLAGPVGAYLSALLFTLFGFAAFVVVIYLVIWSIFFLINRRIPNMVTKSTGYMLLTLALAAIVDNLWPLVSMDGIDVRSGGFIGFILNDLISGQIKSGFAFFLFFILMLIALTLVARFSMRRLMKWLMVKLADIWQTFRLYWQEKQQKKEEEGRIKRIEDKYQQKVVKNEPRVEVVKKALTPDEGEKKRLAREPSKLPEEGLLFGDLNQLQAGGYHPPPLTYLDAPTERTKIDEQELQDKMHDLAQRLQEFKISGRIVEYTPGPVITTYEFVPDTGVKVKDVTNLAEDLALVAKAQYVRIERILGKMAIGIEIPNKKREIIHLREILESQEYRNSRSPLTIALGKSKNGEIFITDLREMPHLIIAGATGSGKSVAIHTVLLSILYKASPDEVKLVLIDPKRVELAIYNTLPHLLTPVVVNTKLARNALDWAVYEMEERYKKLAMLQVRNLEQYNKRIELLVHSDGDIPIDLGDPVKLPYIVIVIDEFADLMMESAKEIEYDVARIAQKARAVGIHMILATQRPSVDVITGTIKNNFPSRIALAVPSKHDSRTVIDTVGAEKLLGHGDMLFLPPKTAVLVRLHCAYVSEEEALRVVKYLAQQQKPKFNTQVVKPQSAREEEGGEEGDLDELFYQAAEIVISTGQASTSFLQRRLSVGYARAGRIMDQLEAQGVVSEANSRNQREILLGVEELADLRDGGGAAEAEEDPQV